MAKYLLKRRAPELGNRNPYCKGGYARRASRWVTVARADTLREAWAQVSNVGLYEWAVFFRGRRLTDGQGRELDRWGRPVDTFQRKAT